MAAGVQQEDCTTGREEQQEDLGEAAGSVTEYRFSDEKENEAIPDGRFEFSPPPGTETVESEIGH